jgi:hypothetical protein
VREPGIDPVNAFGLVGVERCLFREPGNFGVAENVATITKDSGWKIETEAQILNLLKSRYGFKALWNDLQSSPTSLKLRFDVGYKIGLGVDHQSCFELSNGPK